MEGKGTDPYPLWLLHCFAMIEGILTELEVKGLGHASAMKTVGLVFYGDDNIYLGVTTSHLWYCKGSRQPRNQASSFVIVTITGDGLSVSRRIVMEALSLEDFKPVAG